jgi:hypothetical protein
MTWRKARFGLFRYDSGSDRVAPTFLGCLVSAFRSREDLVLENLALHQQFWLRTPNDLAVD